jgi:hypothetical protein
VSDPMAPVSAKLERAEEHLAALREEIQAYFAREPYRIEKEEREEGEIGLVWKVRVRESPPLRWSAIAGDVIHNVRSALDLLAWQLVLANGAQPGAQTGFPILEGERAVRAALLRAMRGAHGDAVQLALECRPWASGNPALWKLHRLDIADKHRLLVTVGGAYRHVGIRLKMEIPGQEELVEVPEIALRPADRLFPLKDGDEVFGYSRQALENEQEGMIHDEPSFAFEIAFGEGEYVEGEPLLETLAELFGAVRGLVERFRPFLQPSELN